MFSFNRKKKLLSNEIHSLQKKSFIRFEFKEVGSYMSTTVTIKAQLHFQQLHLLFKLPLAILKAYWGQIHLGKHVNRKRDGLLFLEAQGDALTQEQKAVQLIEKITTETDIIEVFPNETKEKSL